MPTSWRPCHVLCVLALGGSIHNFISGDSWLCPPFSVIRAVGAGECLVHEVRSHENCIGLVVGVPEA